jgi:hypothetical protein
VTRWVGDAALLKLPAPSATGLARCAAPMTAAMIDVFEHNVATYTPDVHTHYV